MAIGRNEPCPCGSKLKYKNCCAGKSQRGVSKGLITLLVVIAIIAAVGVIGAITGRNKESAIPAAPAGVATSPGKPQPGPAPPGKVWSVEHGHWHDAGAPAGNAPSPVQITQAKAPVKMVPQPAGQAPPGKVWSPEHGHWHDAPK